MSLPTSASNLHGGQIKAIYIIDVGESGITPRRTEALNYIFISNNKLLQVYCNAFRVVRPFPPFY